GVLASTGERRANTDAGVQTRSDDVDERRHAVSWTEATRNGTVGDHRWGERCDEQIGRMMIPSVYAPPCVAARDDVEGGDTYRGVTEDAIRVVLYEAADDDLTALLADKTDPPDVAFEQQKMQIEMWAQSLEMWGSVIDVDRMKGTGADEASSLAD